MKMGNALILVAVGGFFYLLARKRPTGETDPTERVDVNEVVDGETGSIGVLEYTGSSEVVVSFSGVYNIGTMNGDLFYPIKGVDGRRIVFSTLSAAVAEVQRREKGDDNVGGGSTFDPTLPERDPLNPVGGDWFGGSTQGPTFGW